MILATEEVITATLNVISATTRGVLVSEEVIKAICIVAVITSSQAKITFVLAGYLLCGWDHFFSG